MNLPNLRQTFAFLRAPIAAAVLVAGATLSATPSAEAQFGGRGGVAQLFVPEYLGRDLPIFVDTLQLEEWQRPILEALLEDYNTNFNTAADGVRQAFSGLKDAAAGTSPDKVIELVQGPIIRWSTEKVKLREDFLANVKSQLSDSQAELWPALERALRREKSLPNGELSGETLNLLFILRELDASPAAADAARAAVEEYETNLDAALAAREALMQGLISTQLNAMSNPDPSAGVQLAEQIMAKRVAVRNVQDAAIKAIASALGEEYGPQFERRAMQRAFPQVYRPDPVTPLFEAAEALPDLSDDQKTSLKALRDRFNTDYPAFQARFADGYRATEPLEPRRRTEMAQNRGAGTSKYSEAPQIEALKKERDEMFAKYREELSAILNEAQQSAIPSMGKKGVDSGDPAPVGEDLNVRGPDATPTDAQPVKPARELAPDIDAKPVRERGTPPAGQGLSNDSKGTSGSGSKGSKKGG
ncbi:MAG: hypothetical protein RL591_1314 [Planctomycetota bacterium]